MTTIQPLQPLNPMLHGAYAPLLDEAPAVRDAVRDLVRQRATAPDADLDVIDRAIVARSYWYVLRPDEIARQTLRAQHLPTRGPLMIAQATIVLAAIAEAGYPIAGNGAPEYADACVDPPVRGAERDRVIWAAAQYWAEAASRPLTYISLGDDRGYLPRPVQLDQPGGMDPKQRAALTLGPWADRGDQCNSHGYMRRHTRRLLLVRA